MVKIAGNMVKIAGNMVKIAGNMVKIAENSDHNIDSGFSMALKVSHFRLTCCHLDADFFAFQRGVDESRNFLVHEPEITHMYTLCKFLHGYVHMYVPISLLMNLGFKILYKYLVY
jgi:hypothetical protein